MNQTDIANSLQIVRCTHVHASQIVELLYALYLELEEGNETMAAYLLTEDAVRKILNDGKTTVIAATDGAMLVGIVTVTESWAFYTGGMYGSIDELYIRPECRGKSIGRQLIDEVRKVAVQKGWQRVVVNTPKGNVKWGDTIRFYERNGFEKMGNMLKLAL